MSQEMLSTQWAGSLRRWGTTKAIDTKTTLMKLLLCLPEVLVDLILEYLRSQGMLIVDTDMHRVLVIFDTSVIFDHIATVQPGVVPQLNVEKVARKADTLLILRSTTNSLKRPYDAIYHPLGCFVVADKENNRMVVFDSKGNITTEFFMGPSSSVDLPPGPTCVALTANHTVVVGHSTNHAVTEFSLARDLSKLTEVRKFAGTADHSIEYANGIVVAPDGRILLSDNSHTVHIFAADGTVLAPLTSIRLTDKPDLRQLSFSWPWHMSMKADGTFWLVDKERSRILLLDTDGNVLNGLRRTSPPFNLTVPRGIAIDEHAAAGRNFLWVAVTGSNSIMGMYEDDIERVVCQVNGLRSPGAVKLF